MAASSNFSFIGWFIVPRVVTYLIQTVYYVAITPLGEPKPAPNSPRHKRDKSRILATIITVYLLFTVADDFYNVINDPRNPNSSVNSLYSVLEMQPPVPGDDNWVNAQSELRSNFRRLSRKYHPDKIQAQASAAQRNGPSKATAGGSAWTSYWAGKKVSEDDYLNWTTDQIDLHFIKIKSAHDVLSNPVTRYGYERFGAPALKWAGKTDGLVENEDKNTATVGNALEIMTIGLKSSLMSYYAGSIIVVGIMYAINYPKTGHAWRLFIILIGFMIELFVVTRPLSMVYSTFPIMKWLGLLPYQMVTILHKLMITSVIALNQLGPIFSEDPENDELGGTKKSNSAKAAALAGVPGAGIVGGGVIPPLSTTRGQQLLEKQLEFLEQLTDSISHESTQAYRHQMLPFLSNNDKELLKNVNDATVKALVDRQVMSDAEVRDAVETYKKALVDVKPSKAATEDTLVDVSEPGSITSGFTSSKSSKRAKKGLGSAKRAIPRQKLST